MWADPSARLPGMPIEHIAEQLGAKGQPDPNLLRTPSSYGAGLANWHYARG